MEHLAGQYFLNSDLREDEIRKQIGMLCEAGYEVIFLHARAGLKTPYFSQEWFDALGFAIDELIRHGVRFAVWDEDNYPSGDAGNRICNSYPELASSYLNFHVVNAKAGERTTEFFSVNGAFAGCFAVCDDGTVLDLSRHCGTLRKDWGPAYVQSTAYSPAAQLPYPHRRRSMDTPRFAVVWTPDRDCRIVCVEWIRRGPGRHSGDLLNPETARVLLDLIHSEYERRFPDRLKHCAASFMDEPCPAGNYPWTRRFPEEFRQDHGYDLMPLLPHLVLDIDARSVRIRNDYRKTLHRLLCQNYLEPVRCWLKDRSIASSGHLSRSEYLTSAGLHWPDELRCFKHFDIPCCDPLGAGIGQPGAAAHHIGIKAVSSAARLFGKTAAGADAFAVGGDTISLRDLTFMLNYHLVMGVTWFNVHGLYYTLEGERRDEAPPSLFYQHSQWPHMKAFLDYLKRRCSELTGEHLCNLEMLYPSTALQCRLPEEPGPDDALHLTAEELVSRQRDFELIDEQTLCEQDPAGFAALRPYFLVAHAAWIERAAAQWLERYAAAGGHLCVVGVTPKILPEPDSDGMEKWTFADSHRDPDFIGKIPAPELKGDFSENILIRRIRKDGRDRTFLFNRGRAVFRGSLEGYFLEIAPGRAGFAEELRARKKVSPRTVVSPWKLTLGLNSVPMHYWESGTRFAFDLISKFGKETTTEQDPGTWHSVFTLEQPLEKVLFTAEEDSLRKGEFRLNGTVLRGFRKADFRDCRELECEATALLRPGRNILTFQGERMENAPYLRGHFTVRFPLGNCGYPVLSAAPAFFELAEPRDYRSLGYGTFSGTAVYEGTIEVARPGRYELDLGLVNDSVRILLDGVEQGTRIAPPYCAELELARGKHSVRLEVCNAPGNRDVLAGLPAGIQGQICLYPLETGG